MKELRDAHHERMSALHVSRIGGGVSCLADVTELSDTSRSLSLHCNNVRSLAGLNRFTALESVVASNNLISHLGALGGLTGLTSLKLSSNLLTDIDAIRALDNLQCLDVSYNRLDQLQAFKGKDGVNCLPKLRNLDVSHNHIDMLEELHCLTGISNLQQLCFEGQEFDPSYAPDIRAIKAAVAAAFPQVSA